MEIPSDVIAAKEALEVPLLRSGLITGIDFGLRDEDAPDPDDVALRVFVSDAEAVPADVQLALNAFPFPVVLLQRVFEISPVQLPDKRRLRPVLGGTSVAASRFFAAGTVHAGTLGGIVRDAIQEGVFFGLSNYHVLCVDSLRQSGVDEIVQPEPGVLGVLAGDRIGTLARFSFPETTPDGPVDAAICTLESASVPEVEEIGPVFGIISATPGMLVTKRGRTTGQTFGIVTGIDGSYPFDYSPLAPVGNPPSQSRTLTHQIQVRSDFPQSIEFGNSGDSGSLVIGPDSHVVGLYWGSGSASPGDPLKFGVVTPAAAVETALSIRFL